MSMEELEGGRSGQIFRSKGIVLRPSGAWTQTVHRFLRYLAAHGFSTAPAPFGMNERGQELLSFVSGRVARSLLDGEARSETVLLSAGALLRRFHHASAGFLEADREPQHWMLASREPREVVCHGDFAPHNVTLSSGRASGLIDFDTAHPAPRRWDLAYAVYRWAPLSDPNGADIPFTTAQQAQRAGRFCGAYSVTSPEASALPALVCERLDSLCEFIETAARKGDPVFQAHIDAGCIELYRRDIQYVQKHHRLFAASIASSCAGHEKAKADVPHAF